MEKLKDVRVLATLGVLLAVGVALKFVASIDIGPYVRVGFAELPTLVTGAIYGPVIGAVFGAVLDIVRFFVTPQSGPFFPGFTISAALLGLVYGLFLYNKEITWGRVILAELVRKVVINIGLNSIWLKLLYDQAIIAMLPARALKNAIMLPIDVVISFFLLRGIKRAYELTRREAP
ncbi:MAG: folate family ECF transporter S component [Lachnospiraceae bacterium]|nr:folate family ECF transporter S component [Lachnospiraceae bacterium]